MSNLNPIYKAVFPFAHTTLTQKIKVAEQVLEKSKSSAVLAPGDPLVAALQQAVQSVDQTESQIATLERQLGELRATRKSGELEFHRACLAYTGLVNTLARGDEAIIRGTGLEALAPPQRRAQTLAMTTPLSLVVAAGARPGEVHLRWLMVKGAKSYVIEASRVSADGYAHVATVTTRRAVLLGQPSGVPTFYRVAAVGPTGGGLPSPGPFGEPVAVVAR